MGILNSISIVLCTKKTGRVVSGAVVEEFQGGCGTVKDNSRAPKNGGNILVIREKEQGGDDIFKQCGRIES